MSIPPALTTSEADRLLETIEGVRRGSVDPTGFLEAIRQWLKSPSESTDSIVRACVSSLDASAETAFYPPKTASVSPDVPREEAPGGGDARPRYRVTEALAAGGLGAVDRAWDVELGREVALKRIRREHASDPQGRARFLREGWITAALEHPGVVPVHGRGRFADGQPFFAMRLVRGRTLREAIDRLHGVGAAAVGPADDGPGSRFPNSLRGLVGRVVQACHAVEYAHSRGIIHRDLKPENILLGPFGETLVVDWGLAKPIGVHRLGAEPSDVPSATTADDLPADSLATPGASIGEETRPGQVQGTIGYMSPEQARGDHDAVGVASDVYGLGATLYCLLTGRTPVRVDTTAAEALDRVVRGEITPPSLIASGVDAELERICRRSMVLDPSLRYPSAGALAAALEEWLAEERAEAVRRLFTAALGAYGTLVFTVQDRLRPIPAAHSIREDLLNRAIRGLEELVEHAGRDHAREVVRSLASAYQQIADLEQQLGRTADARKHYELALSSFESMTGGAAEARDIGPLSITRGKLGDILRRQGELVAAREQYLRGLDLTRALASLDPRSTRARRGLEIVLGKLSSLSRQMGEHDDARQYQEESLSISRSLLDASPNDPRARRGMAISLGRHGDICRESGDLESARESYARGFDLSEALFRGEPNDLATRRGLAIACNKLAEVSRLLGDLPAARTAALRGLEVAELLCRDDPWNVPARRDLAIACNRLGDIDRESGALEEARGWFRRGLELMRSLVQADRDDAHARRGLLLVLLRVGELHHLLGAADEARGCLGEALVMAEALALAEAHDVQAQLDVARACQLLGRLEADTGAPERSGVWFARGIALLQSLRDRDRLAPGPGRLLAELEADLESTDPEPDGGGSGRAADR